MKTKKLTREQANKKTNSNLEQVKKLLDECIKMADEHGLSFDVSFDIGQKYHGKGREDPLDWDSSSGNPRILEAGIWTSSSDFC